MKPVNCCLTLLCHRSLEERLVDDLLERPELVMGFTITSLGGHSLNEKLPSMSEQVRGRSQRVEIRVLMNQKDAHALVAQLKEAEPSHPEVTYWISPLIEFGSLA